MRHPVHLNDINHPIEDEEIASRTDAALLVSALTRREVEQIARRVHLASPRAAAPFVPIHVGDLLTSTRPVTERCAALFDGAVGGSVLLAMAEDMSPSVQDAILHLLDDLRRSKAPARPPRLITGTTVSLVDRVAGGDFSERLFYRLNLIHIGMSGGACGTNDLADDHRVPATAMH